MARPIVKACVTRALIRGKRVAMTVCPGDIYIKESMCHFCEYWTENQYNPEDAEVVYADGIPAIVCHNCGLSDGFRAIGKEEPCCDGDPDMPGYCHTCEFYERSNQL